MNRGNRLRCNEINTYMMEQEWLATWFYFFYPVCYNDLLSNSVPVYANSKCDPIMECCNPNNYCCYLHQNYNVIQLRFNKQLIFFVKQCNNHTDEQKRTLFLENKQYFQTNYNRLLSNANIQSMLLVWLISSYIN